MNCFSVGELEIVETDNEVICRKRRSYKRVIPFFLFLIFLYIGVIFVNGRLIDSGFDEDFVAIGASIALFPFFIWMLVYAINNRVCFLFKKKESEIHIPASGEKGIVVKTDGVESVCVFYRNNSENCNNRIFLRHNNCLVPLIETDDVRYKKEVYSDLERMFKRFHIPFKVEVS